LVAEQGERGEGKAGFGESRFHGFVAALIEAYQKISSGRVLRYLNFISILSILISYDLCARKNGFVANLDLAARRMRKR
jgi:hypothetical protein